MAKRLISLGALALFLAALMWAGNFSVRPVAVAGKPAPLAPPSLASRQADVASEARKNRAVGRVLKSVQALDKRDQAGLDKLFDEMQGLIGEDPDGMHAELESRIPEFPELPLENSFFLVHSFLKFGDRPVRVVEKILDHDVPDNPASRDSHGHVPTRSEHYERVKAFALRHFHDAIKANEVGQAALAEGRRTLLPRIKHIAAEERSLDIAREATKLLARLSPYPESDLEEALRGRPPEERRFLIP